jgi:hypothetical protein
MPFWSTGLRDNRGVMLHYAFAGDHGLGVRSYEGRRECFTIRT